MIYYKDIAMKRVGDMILYARHGVWECINPVVWLANGPAAVKSQGRV